MTAFKETNILKYPLVLHFVYSQRNLKQNQGSAQQSILSQVLCWNENIPFQNRIPSGVWKLLSLWSQSITQLTVALKYKG